jgi:FHS family L-fucose permease-like MFS transporter
MLHTLVTTPRYWFGVIAQFFYVGVQIAAWTWLNVYCQKELGVTPAQGAIYYTIAISLFIACRWIATFAMKYFNPAAMMAVFAVCAILCCAGVIYLPTNILFTAWNLPFSANIICLVAMLGFMSLMFPTIYGIALGGLDQKALKLGASGLIMAILGGAIITPWMANIIGDANSFWTKLVPMFSGEWDTNLKLTQASLRASFVVPAICFAVVGVYAVVFRRAKKPEQSA